MSVVYSFYCWVLAYCTSVTQLLIQSWQDILIHVGYLYDLAIKNTEKMYMSIQVFVTYILLFILNWYLKVEFLGHVITLCLTLLKKKTQRKSCQMVFLSIWALFHTTSIVYEFQFFHILVSTWYCWSIIDLAMVDISLCVLFASTWWLIMLNILFMCLYFYLYHFFSEVPFSDLLLAFIFLFTVFNTS